MAESQVPYPYHPAQLAGIQASLSAPRFGAYLLKGGNDARYALLLYLYNARLAKAFLYPLHVAEVTLRNAVDSMLVGQLGAAWTTDVPTRQANLSGYANGEIANAISRLGPNATHGQIIAELTFGFWAHLVHSQYHALWRTTFALTFPHHAGKGRGWLFDLCLKINRFRNRVAHHEPILDQNIPDRLSEIYELIGCRCPQTLDWTRHHSTVNTVLRSKPKLEAVAAAESLSKRLAPDFAIATAGTKISEVMAQLNRKRQAAICVDDDGKPIAGFSALDLSQYVIAAAKEMDGLVAVNEHTVGDLLATLDVTSRTSQIPAAAPFDEAVKILKGLGTDILIGVDEAGLPIGTIIRAHRRY